MEPFTPQEDEKLIALIKKQPLLYDISHDSYKDQHKREEIWIQIAEELDKSVCKKHWRSLRDGYARFRRNIKTGYNYTHTRHKVKWHIYDQLSFLDPVFGGSPLNEEINSEVEIHEGNEDDILVPIGYDTLCTLKEEKTISKTVKKRSPRFKRIMKRSSSFVRRDEILDYIKRIDKSYDSFFKAVLKKQTRERDLGSFAAHIQAVLKKFPPLLQAQAKQELFAVLSKYEMASIENGMSIYNGSSDNSPQIHCESLVKIEHMQ